MFISGSFRRTITIHYGLLFILSANFAVWFFTVLNDSEEMFNNRRDDTKCRLNDSQYENSSSYISCIFRNNTMHSSLNESHPYLLPMGIEYSLLAGGLILQMWHSTKDESEAEMRHSTEDENEARQEHLNAQRAINRTNTELPDESDERSELLADDPPNYGIEETTTRAPTKRSFVWYMSILSSVIIDCLLVLFIQN